MEWSPPFLLSQMRVSPGAVFLLQAFFSPVLLESVDVVLVGGHMWDLRLILSFVDPSLPCGALTASASHIVVAR